MKSLLIALLVSVCSVPAFASTPKEDVDYALELLQRIDSSRLSSKDTFRLLTAIEKVRFAKVALEQNPQASPDSTTTFWMCVNSADSADSWGTEDSLLLDCVSRYSSLVPVSECSGAAKRANWASTQDNIARICAR